MIVLDKNELIAPSVETTLFEGQAILDKLKAELNNSKTLGIGLAAPQIGIKKQVVIIRSSQKIDLINPKIIKQYDLREFDDEGCLSFPDDRVTTQRYNEILVTDLIHPAGIICVGINAVVVQHELDHLNGILMFDREIKIPHRNSLCWCGSRKKYKSCHRDRKIKEDGT